MSSVHITETGDMKIARISKILAGVKGGAFRAVYWAMKRAGESAKTEAGRFASAEYAITKGEFMANTKMVTQSKSGSGEGYVRITYAGHVLTLLSFRTSFSRKGKVSTQVMRNGDRTTFDRAFVANIWGHTGVYERLTPSRFPLHELYGPSTAHMMQNEKVIKQMDEKITEVFDRRLDHEVLRILNGWGGG